MSLRWIHENLIPPNCDEECSDIDDSCSDDSYDSDLIPAGDDNANNNNTGINNVIRTKRESLRHPVTTVIIENGKPHFETDGLEKKLAPCMQTWDPDRTISNPITQSLKLKLFCRTGYYIGITTSGRIKGFPSDSTNDAHVRFIVCPVSHGLVRLQNAETGHYLAFNSTGHLYGESKIKDNTEWEQWNIGSYDAFRSHKYAEAGWWLGIKRNGRHKPGPKTAWGQKAIQFLIIRLAL